MAREGGEGGVARLQVFGVGWALAAWFHLMGNARGDLDPSNVALVAAIAVVLARPTDRRALVGLALAGVWTAWDEAPVLSNHWLLFCLVNLALVASAVVTGVRARRAALDRDTATERFVDAFVPAARWTLLVFYGFAGFAKLNSAFFDRTVSCATFFLDESLGSIGLDGLGLQDSAGVQWFVIVATAAIELSIPVLLVLRRTRRAGVVLAVAFHALLAVDRTHLFVDFSSLLTVLFLLFLPPDFATRVVDGVRSVGLRVEERLRVRPAVLGAAGIIAVVVAGVAAELSVPSATSSRTLSWWVWQPLVLGLVGVLVGCLRHWRAEPAPAFAPIPGWLLLVPALTLLNSLSPYLELKTAHSGNMYSNLRVVDGDSNHFIVRAGLPLTDEHRDLIRIVSSSDPGLQSYADTGLALTRTQLRSYLAEHPEVGFTYESNGERVVVARAGDRPELVRPVSEVRRKLVVFRSVGTASREACLAYWGPAN